jgi:competence protein ComFC
MSLAGFQARPVYTFYHLIWTAIDWVYPPDCGGCEKPGVRWCSDCQAQVTRPDLHLCPLCGRPQPNPSGSICSACHQSNPGCADIRSWAIFQGPIREAIHRLKYRGDIGLSETFTTKLVELLVELNWKVDMVAAVPLSRQRFKQRGYNQAGLLGWSLSKALCISYASQAIVRIRNTGTQVGLSIRERQENVSGAFSASPRLVRGRNVLVIDDVLTTGATMQACARAFLEAGANSVYGLTLARAPSHDHRADPDIKIDQ